MEFSPTDLFPLSEDLPFPTSVLEFDSLLPSASKTKTIKDENYERKKSRAKISRQEVNAKYTELIDLLNYPTNGKGNRAKILEAAIQKIRTLQLQLQQTQQQLQQFTIANPCPLSTASMVWVPYTLQPSKKPKQTIHVSKDTLVDQVFRNCEVYQFCDAISLAKAMQACQQWKRACRSNTLWRQLCMKRWKLTEPELAQCLKQGNAFGLWKAWHRKMVLPHGVYAKDAIIFAQGQQQYVNFWCTLGHRSNSRTTRTVLSEGKVQVVQIVELRCFFQNIQPSTITVDLASIRIQNQMKECFELATKRHGMYLQPRLVVQNGNLCDVTDIQVFSLGSTQYAVASVFVICPGREYETDFLLDAQSISVQYQQRNHHQQTISASFQDDAFVWQHYVHGSGGIVSRRTT